jgi:hypothetical protein
MNQILFMNRRSDKFQKTKEENLDLEHKQIK